MTGKKRLEYEDVQNTPPHELLKLSYEELDALIREAEHISEKASTVSKWLSAIKIEKVRANHLPSSKEGGAP